MTSIPFSLFLVELETTPGSGVYARPLGITSKGFDRTFKAVEAERPDDTDESIPSETLRGIASQDWKLTGAFTMVQEDAAAWRAREGHTFNVRITKNVPQASGGGYWLAPAVLTQISEKSDKGAAASTGDITIDGAGRLVWTNASA